MSAQKHTVTSVAPHPPEFSNKHDGYVSAYKYYTEKQDNVTKDDLQRLGYPNTWSMYPIKAL